MKQTNFWKAIVKEGGVLNPVDRISEVLFGLIMVLTFTGCISAATDGKDEIRQLLWAALGCNVAWGLVDAIMYLMNLLIERGHAINIIHKLQQSGNQQRERTILKDEIQPLMAHLLQSDELDQLAARIKQLPPPEKKNIISQTDLFAGLQIFMLVFFCTLPVALPFAIFEEVPRAMRVSNGVALLMLFIGGYKLAMYAGFRPWITALLYAFIGVLLVALTMALGG